jgi:hypothetical protein
MVLPTSNPDEEKFIQIISKVSKYLLIGGLLLVVISIITDVFLLATDNTGTFLILAFPSISGLFSLLSIVNILYVRSRILHHKREISKQEIAKPVIEDQIREPQNLLSLSLNQLRWLLQIPIGLIAISLIMAVITIAIFANSGYNTQPKAGVIPPNTLTTVPTSTNISNFTPTSENTPTILPTATTFSNLPTHGSTPTSTPTIIATSTPIPPGYLTLLPPTHITYNQCNIPFLFDYRLRNTGGTEVAFEYGWNMDTPPTGFKLQLSGYFGQGPSLNPGIEARLSMYGEMAQPGTYPVYIHWSYDNGQTFVPGGTYEISLTCTSPW